MTQAAISQFQGCGAESADSPTVRPAFLPIYGHPLVRAPNMQALARDGYYYERYPYYYDEYGLTWFTRDAFENLVSETVPELSLVAYHAMDVDAHQDIFVYRKTA